MPENYIALLQDRGVHPMRENEAEIFIIAILWGITIIVLPF